MQGCHIWVKVTPNSHVDECIEFTDGVLRVRLRASPFKGNANQALIEYLSKHFDIPKSKIFIQKGKTSRLKEIFLQDCHLTQITKKTSK